MTMLNRQTENGRIYFGCYHNEDNTFKNTHTGLRTHVLKETSYIPLLLLTWCYTIPWTELKTTKPRLSKIRSRERQGKTRSIILS